MPTGAVSGRLKEDMQQDSLHLGAFSRLLLCPRGEVFDAAPKLVLQRAPLIPE